MLMYKNQLQYDQDSSAGNVERLVLHTYKFFEKYERILEVELQQIQA